MSMPFNLFVLPFTVGLAFLLLVFTWKCYVWFKGMSSENRNIFIKGFFSLASFRATKEIFMESLIHRKIFKVNPLLGYMHMSLAFGWFMLILIGNIQTKFYTEGAFNPPYFPIFFSYFVTESINYPFATIFNFLMDFFLLLVLTGLLLAISKRFYSSMLGLKKTTQHSLGDRLALLSLWLIFPLRLFAEMITASIYKNGDFLVGSLAALIPSSFPSSILELPVWWAYSFSLGLFFVALPFSRYMHIPTEIVLILSRHFNLKRNLKLDSISSIEIHACSRCGICLDTCQLLVASGIGKAQSVYFLKNLRDNKVDLFQMYSCMHCGRCTEVCPVGIGIGNLRLAARNESGYKSTSTYDFIRPPVYKRADVVYFAGCMTQLTQGIKRAMLHLLDHAGVNYFFMDSVKEACCGRPLMLLGQVEEATKLINYNKDLIARSGAKILITSCPICYKTFKDDYNLDIQVMHHSEYLLELIKTKKILPEKNTIKTIYHDPCELGRASGIYNEPREIINSVSRLIKTENEKENAFCCGGSLASTSLQFKQRDDITIDVLEKWNAYNPEILVTSCPLCKKIFSKHANYPVQDIAEILYKSIAGKESENALTTKKNTNILIESIN